ncbi:MAG TPA: hypothetical protein VF786_11850 [Terriglobales bacterium]
MPFAVGVNVTLVLQLVFGERVVPQLFACEKSPEVEIEEIVTFSVPVFVTVTVWGALVVFINWVENVRAEVETFTAALCAVGETLFEPPPIPHDARPRQPIAATICKI